MKLLLIIALLGGCKREPIRYDGLPAGSRCSGYDSSLLTCVSPDHLVFTCVFNDYERAALCARALATPSAERQ